MSDNGWFVGVEPGDTEAGAARIREGSAASPEDWPALAVAAGFAESEADYYAALRETSIAAARAGVTERERAGDKQLIHAVRAMDDCERTANELAERLSEWAGSLFEEARPGVDGARIIADREPADPNEERVVSLAERVVGLDDEATALRSYIERTAPEVAPNLSRLAGPVLGTRLIAIAGGLDVLAKKPSGTVQVLGAEDALFAHLRGRAPSPKHGIIFTHEYVRGTHPDERGSAARALAGKLAIAARVDHYSGEMKPDLERELDERIERIRSRREQ